MAYAAPLQDPTVNEGRFCFFFVILQLPGAFPLPLFHQEHIVGFAVQNDSPTSRSAIILH